MTARIPQSVREEQLNALPGKRFVRWADGYRNAYSKAVMVCGEGHEWQASVSDLVNSGRGCPKCSGRYKYSSKERETQLNMLPRRTFLRWVGDYKNGDSKATMRCDIDGCEWSATVDSMLNGGRGCPMCAGKYRYSSAEREAQLNSLTGYMFVRWLGGGYTTTNKSKAVMRCDHGHEWAASVSNLINVRSGCPKCSGTYVYSAKEREDQLNARTNLHFVRWVDGYKDSESKALMACDEGHEWCASVNNMINNGSGCPACAKTGYDPTKPGAIYALLHENGCHIKVGISNVYKQRLSQLRNATPFRFEVIHMHQSEDGHVIAALEKTFHQNFEKSGFTGFDGATEWLKFNPDILTIMRILGA